MMKRITLAIIIGLFFSSAQALDVVEQRYVDKLTRGGNTSIKQVAQSIYNSGEKNTEVLDVLAEVLLQRYPAAAKNDVDTLAWAARALGSSGNGRYFSTLDEVLESDAAHKKLKKYAKKARKELGGKKGEQYTKGLIDLSALRSSGNKVTAKKVAVIKKAPKPSGKHDLDIVREGMSMPEVYDLVGNPTATTSHQTGKGWIPFNYKGGDLMRTIALYKGEGRVIFSHNSRYNTTMRVLEVIIDPDESGYP